MKVGFIRARQTSRSIPPRESEMIYANAVVDVIDEPPPHGQGLGKFRVECWGKEPHDYVRVYEIAAKNENAAAKEGLDRFVVDIEALLASKA